MVNQDTAAGSPMRGSGTCPNCHTLFAAGQRFCGNCGQSFAEPGLADPLASHGADQQSLGQESRGGAADGPPYDHAVILGAVLLSVFMPLIALIVALILRGQERIRARRRFLKNWAVGSAAWLATGWLIGLIAVIVIGTAVVRSASCQGGIDQTVPPTYDSTDGKHWTGTFTCYNGGTITKPVPASSVFGGAP